MKTEEKRICMECGQSFRINSMLRVGRKMFCKECGESLLEEHTKSVRLGKDGINIVNQQTQTNSSDRANQKYSLLQKIISLIYYCFSLFKPSPKSL